MEEFGVRYETTTLSVSGYENAIKASRKKCMQHPPREVKYERGFKSFIDADVHLDSVIAKGLTLIKSHIYRIK